VLWWLPACHREKVVSYRSNGGYFGDCGVLVGSTRRVNQDGVLGTDRSSVMDTERSFDDDDDDESSSKYRYLTTAQCTQFCELCTVDADDFRRVLVQYDRVSVVMQAVAMERAQWAVNETPYDDVTLQQRVLRELDESARATGRGDGGCSARGSWAGAVEIGGGGDGVRGTAVMCGTVVDLKSPVLPAPTGRRRRTRGTVGHYDDVDDEDDDDDEPHSDGDGVGDDDDKDDENPGRNVAFAPVKSPTGVERGGRWAHGRDRASVISDAPTCVTVVSDTRSLMRRFPGNNRPRVGSHLSTGSGTVSTSSGGGGGGGGRGPSDRSVLSSTSAGTSTLASHRNSPSHGASSRHPLAVAASDMGSATVVPLSQRNRALRVFQSIIRAGAIRSTFLRLHGMAGDGGSGGGSGSGSGGQWAANRGGGDSGAASADPNRALKRVKSARRLVHGARKSMGRPGSCGLSPAQHSHGGSDTAGKGSQRTSVSSASSRHRDSVSVSLSAATPSEEPAAAQTPAPPSTPQAIVSPTLLARVTSMADDMPDSELAELEDALQQDEVEAP
jgi:hypothetical protein